MLLRFSLLHTACQTLVSEIVTRNYPGSGFLEALLRYRWNFECRNLYRLRRSHHHSRSSRQTLPEYPVWTRLSAIVLVHRRSESVGFPHSSNTVWGFVP